MGPDLTQLPRTDACPSCGASLRADAPWCTLCYADLRPKAAPAVQPDPMPAPVPVPIFLAPTVAYGTPAGDPLTQPLLAFLPQGPTQVPMHVPAQAAPAVAPVAEQVPITWPCVQCGAANPMTLMACTDCGIDFLAAERSGNTPMLVLPIVGDIGQLSRGQRIGLAFAAVGVVLAPLALITLLLTGSPPPDRTVVNQPSPVATP